MPDKSYTVIEPKEPMRLMDQDGKVQTYTRIWARSAKGTKFFIDILESDLARAPAMLEAKAKQYDSI